MADSQAISERMRYLIQGWEAASDRRAVFLDCYLRMTVNMLSAVKAVEFQDSPWVGTLLHRFAEYYFDGLSAYEAGSSATPAVWRQAHDATRSPGVWTVQNLLLGVNAHINYDLVLALVDVLELEWSSLSEAGRLLRYTDHCHVNEIIRQTIDAVQDEVIERYSPNMDWVDKAMGRMDEWMIARLIAGWRDEVWRNAIGLLETPDPGARQARINQIERSALQLGERILLTGLM